MSDEADKQEAIANQLHDAVERYYLQIQSRFMSLIADSHTVDDLSQEVFARLWVKLREGYPIEDVWAFILGLTKNVTLEHFRKKKQRGSVLLDELEIIDACPTPDRISEQKDMSEKMIGLVQQLEADERAIISGRYLFEMSGKEIAEWLDMPCSTVFDRHNRAMRNLRRLAIENGIEL